MDYSSFPPLPASDSDLSLASQVQTGQTGDLSKHPNISIWQQSSDDPGSKRLLIRLLNDSLYIMMILFSAQLIEYTGRGVGVGGGGGGGG